MNMGSERGGMRSSGAFTAWRNGIGLSALLLAWACGASAETIREIRVQQQGPVPVEETQVLAHVASKVGDALSPEMIARDVRTLLDTRLYAYVGTRIEPVEQGARLVYLIESRYRLAEAMTVQGNDALSRSRIRELAGLVPGSLVDEQLVNAAALKILEEYRGRRFFDAVVEGQVDPVEGSPGSATVRMTVREGARAKVPLIRFTGNQVLSDRRLRRYSGQSPWWNPSGWFSTKRLDVHDLEILRADVRQQYADLGYLDAEISPPQVTDRRGSRQIAFEISEGVQYRLGRLSVVGVTLFPESAILDAGGLKTGDLASHSVMQRGAAAIRDFYGARGYLDTVVQAGLVPDPEQPDRVHLQYRVKEGSLMHVRNLWIRGNTKTQDKVIRREITLNPGDLYNEVEAKRSERRLSNLGYFETVRHYDLDVPDGTRRDLVYEVEEKPTGQFMIGAGFSSVDKIMGFLELSQSNFDLFNWGRFTGGGQKVRLGLNASRNNTDVELSFVEPWLFDQRLQLNLDAFSRNRSYSEYDERRAGGAIGVSRHVPWVGRMGLTYTLQQVRLKDVLLGEYQFVDEPDQSYRYTEEEDRYLQGSLRLNWIYDTRDHPMNPTRGTRATAAGTLYGEAVGGDVEMYELSLRVRHYVPTFYGHVISFYLRSDVVDSWGGDTVPIGNRYFLGGGRNVRGFRYRAIGPKVRPASASADSATYRPVGGQTLLHASAEYTIPITRFFRIAAFYDIGNVWADPYDVDWSEYASSVGAGFRLDFPGFPIRLDYAYPLEDDDELSRKQRWVFWVGFD